MQNTQLRWMIGLSLLVLVLVAALSMGEGKGPAPSDPDATVQVLDLPDISKVVRVERSVQGESLVLRRTDQGWMMESPDEAEADADVVLRLLDDFREMARGVPLDTEGVDPVEFGLGDPPAADVRLTLEDGSEQRAAFGDAAPVGWRTYARGPDGAIVAVGGRSELLVEPSSAFRDHRVFRFDPGKVRRVRLTVGEHSLDVSGQGTAWWLEGFTRADPDRVDDLVMGLLDLRFDRLMPLDEIGPPRAVVEVELEGGDVQVMRVGERTPMGDVVHSPRATGMVFPESLALLQMGPGDVGDRHAIPLRLDRDDQVELETADGTWEAARTEMSWQSADRAEADTMARLQALLGASIAYRAEPVEAPASVFATVRVRRGEQTKTVELGPEGDDGFHRARDLGGGQPYLVRAAELAPVWE